MSAFTADDVRRLATLARLELDGDELAAFVPQLSDILEFARQVQAVDTTTVTDAAHLTLSPATPARDDVVAQSLARDEALSAAPDADSSRGLFKVPRVLNP